MPKQKMGRKERHGQKQIGNNTQKPLRRYKLTRKFGKRTYHKSNVFLNKSDAKAIAKRLRNKGMLARVTEYKLKKGDKWRDYGHSNGYIVWESNK